MSWRKTLSRVETKHTLSGFVSEKKMERSRRGNNDKRLDSALLCSVCVCVWSVAKLGCNLFTFDIFEKFTHTNGKKKRVITSLETSRERERVRTSLGAGS